MADIFNEIDEDLRRERLNKLWNRFGGYIIGLAVLVVVGVGAWRGYEWWQTREAQASGARFAAALQLATEGKHAEAEAAFAALSKDGTNGYRLLSRFRAAAELAQTDRAAAVAAYDALASDNGLDPLARDVARVRAGLLLVDTAPLADVESRVRPLDTPNGAFRHSAREIIGLAQYRAGDTEAATKTFEGILADGETPPGLRQRAELLRTLASSGAAPTPTAPAAISFPAAPAAEAAPASGEAAPQAPATDAPATQAPASSLPAIEAPALTAPGVTPEPVPEAAAPETTPEPALPAAEPPKADQPADAAPAASQPAAPQ